MAWVPECDNCGGREDIEGLEEQIREQAKQIEDLTTALSKKQDKK